MATKAKSTSAKRKRAPVRRRTPKKAAPRTRVANAEGAARGLELLDAIAVRGELQRYPEFHSARGALLEQLGDATAAVVAYRRARALTRHLPTARHLDGRIEFVMGNLSG